MPSLAVEALGGAGEAADPKALQVLTLYAGNRNPPVRKAAVKALAALPDARVGRGADRTAGRQRAPRCARPPPQALAARKEKRAADRLFKLVAKNDAGAAAPLGVLIAPDDVPQLAELRGRIDDAVLADALGEFLKRPDVPDRLRVDVVRTLARMPGRGGHHRPGRVPDQRSRQGHPGLAGRGPEDRRQREVPCEPCGVGQDFGGQAGSTLMLAGAGGAGRRFLCRGHQARLGLDARG